MRSVSLSRAQNSPFTDPETTVLDLSSAWCHFTDVDKGDKRWIINYNGIYLPTPDRHIWNKKEPINPSLCQKGFPNSLQNSHNNPSHRPPRPPEDTRYHFFRLLDLGAALEETLAARDVEVEVALLPPLTALTCLFCDLVSYSDFRRES